MEGLLTPIGPIFDAVLAVTLIAVAIRVLTAPDAFQAVVVFIVFGLLMSLAWTRLHAVDVALAEAAIGAGLTGALFLNALGPSAAHRARPGRRASAALLPMLLVGAWLVVALSSGVLDPEFDGLGLRDAVAGQIGRSGASNPVTAVLLNFRAYDTLLEIGVMILAVAGVWALGKQGAIAAPAQQDPGAILFALVRVLVPVMGVVAGYLLWIGTAAPGGAFQAGAVLCASGILLVVVGITRGPGPRQWADRALIVLGFAVFLAISVGVMVIQDRFLEYPAAAAGQLILVVEALLTLSIATILVALFTAGETKDSANVSAQE